MGFRNDTVREVCRTQWPCAAAAAALVALACSFARAEESSAERAQRLAAMTAEQKDELLRKKQRFDDMEPPDREKLRELHVAIESSPQAPQLQETLTRYHAWLNTLSSLQRSELLSLSDDERIGKIKELLRQQELQRFQTFAGNLPERDRDIIYRWVAEFIRRHQEELEERLPPDARDRYRAVRDEASRTRMLAFHLQWRWHEGSQPLPTSEDIGQLVPSLSAEAQAHIKQVQTAEEQHQRVKELARAAIMSHLVPRASEEELRKFYDQLPVEQRARLEGLEGEEFKRELRKMYNSARFRERGGPWAGWGGGPRGPRSGDGRSGDGRRGTGSERGPPSAGRSSKGPPPDQRPMPPAPPDPNP
jgi:hypothetical protein